MNKQKSKYFDTASLFDEALISLLEEKELDYITIKEICKKAGFNRSTFYLHYENINDLLNETIDYIIKKLVNYYNRDPKEFIDKLNSQSKEDLNFIKREYLIPYLSFVKENKNVFIASFRNPSTLKANEIYMSLEKYIFDPILEKYGILQSKRKYILQFYIAGVMAIIKEWTINNCLDEISDIANIIIECVNYE